MESVSLHLPQRNAKRRRCCNLAIITCASLLAVLILTNLTKGSDERIVATQNEVGATNLESKEAVSRTQYCHSSISSLFCMSEAVRLSLHSYFSPQHIETVASFMHNELQGTTEESSTEDDGQEISTEDVVEAPSMFLEDEGHGRDLRFVSREGPYTRRRRGFFGSTRTAAPATTRAPVATAAPVAPTDPVVTPAPATSPNPDEPTAAPATTSGPAGPTGPTAEPATSGPAGPTAAPATTGPAGPTAAPATTAPAGPTRAPSPTTPAPAPAGPTTAPATTTTGPAGPTRAPSTTTSSPAGSTPAPAAPSASTSSPASSPTTAPASAAAAAMTRNIFDHEELLNETVIEP